MRDVLLQTKQGRGQRFYSPFRQEVFISVMYSKLMNFGVIDKTEKAIKSFREDFLEQGLR